MPSNENENVSTVNETIVTGKKYRVLKDKINGLWNRISFWTSANDVEFTDSGSLQGKRLNEVVTSIQNSAGVPGDSVVILDNNDAVPEGWELTTKPQDIVDLENAVDEINDNLSGFKFYPSGIQGLLLYDATNSKFWQTSNGEYVLTGTPTAYQVLADNPSITFDGATNTEDLRGKVGADTATPFKGGIDTSYIDEVYKTFAPIDSSGRGQAGYTFTLNLTHTRELLVMESLKEGSISFSVASSDCTVTEIFKRPNSFATSMFCIYLIEGKIGQSYTVNTSASNGTPILTRFALHNNYNINLAFQDLVQSKSFNLTTKKALVLLANFNASGNPTCTSNDANITLLFGNVIQYCKVYIYYVEGEIGDLIVSNTNGNYPATVILDIS